MRRPGVGDAPLRHRARQVPPAARLPRPRRPAAADRGTPDRPAPIPRRRSPEPAPTAPPRGSRAGRAPARPRCSAVDHSRTATPGASRPARPARCSAAAREIRSVVSRVRPVDGSSRGARRQPPSTTMRTPGTVSEVSAIDVASTTRRPSAGRSARSCTAGGRSPCNGSTSAPQPSSAAWVRRISAMPGRKARMSPSCAASAARTARAMASGSSRGPGMSRAAWLISTGNMRPAALDRLRVQQSGKAADLGGGRHGDQPQLRAQHTLQVAAQRQRQVGFHRTLVHLVQDHGGDAVERRIGLQPTDQQALGDDLDAGRRRDGGIEPGAVADRAADGLAAAAPPCGWRRRGWRAGAAPASGCVPSPRHGASSSASGTSVVLPAPGGADSTTLRPAASAASSDGMAWLMGSSGNMLAIRWDLCYM